MQKANNFFRQWAVGCLCVTAFCLGTMTNAVAAAEKTTLSYLSWADYIDPDLVKDFEKKFDVIVKEVYFETDEEREQKLAYTDGKGYDVVLVGGLFVSSYVKRGWVTPMDFSKMPTIKNIDPRWRKAFPQAETNAVPYFWGTLGIAYRKDLVPENIHSWQQFFRPAPAFLGKIGMLNDSSEAIGMALMSLKNSRNNTDAKALAEAEKLLLSQRPYVKTYSTPILTNKSPLVTGELWMSMFYNGDALTLQKFSPQIEYVVPEEGGGLWVDYLMVLQSSKQKDLAMAFINFLNEPENAARLASYLNYASPNEAAKKFLSAEHLNNPVIYPSHEIVSRSEFAEKMPPRSDRDRNLVFSNVKK
ncbi:MAG: spermidine/putrescine ABC transporter substrate-binding protein [Magnetococcales bacterium]|nr:spermidine/putrescine ABC transporter substrate-binding protein [Magnetococcales bacterium]